MFHLRLIRDWKSWYKHIFPKKRKYWCINFVDCTVTFYSSIMVERLKKLGDDGGRCLTIAFPFYWNTFMNKKIISSIEKERFCACFSISSCFNKFLFHKNLIWLIFREFNRALLLYFSWGMIQMCSFQCTWVSFNAGDKLLLMFWDFYKNC